MTHIHSKQAVIGYARAGQSRYHSNHDIHKGISLNRDIQGGVADQYTAQHLQEGGFFIVLIDPA